MIFINIIINYLFLFSTGLEDTCPLHLAPRRQEKTFIDKFFEYHGITRDDEYACAPESDITPVTLVADEPAPVQDPLRQDDTGFDSTDISMDSEMYDVSYRDIPIFQPANQNSTICGRENVTFAEVIHDVSEMSVILSDDPGYPAHGWVELDWSSDKPV